jgi:hypothetical protein
MELLNSQTDADSTSKLCMEPLDWIPPIQLMYLSLNQALQLSSRCLGAMLFGRTNSAGYLFLFQATVEPDSE